MSRAFRGSCRLELRREFWESKADLRSFRGRSTHHKPYISMVFIPSTTTLVFSRTLMCIAALSISIFVCARTNKKHHVFGSGTLIRRQRQLRLQLDDSGHEGISVHSTGRGSDRSDRSDDGHLILIASIASLTSPSPSPTVAASPAAAFTVWSEVCQAITTMISACDNLLFNFDFVM